MKHDTNTLLLAAEVRRLAAALQTIAGSKAWRELHDAGSLDVPRDIWIASDFANRHPLVEFVPAAMRELQVIADEVNRHSA